MKGEVLGFSKIFPKIECPFDFCCFLAMVWDPRSWHWLDYFRAWRSSDYRPTPLTIGKRFQKTEALPIGLVGGKHFSANWIHFERCFYAEAYVNWSESHFYAAVHNARFTRACHVFLSREWLLSAAGCCAPGAEPLGRLILAAGVAGDPVSAPLASGFLLRGR